MSREGTSGPGGPSTRRYGIWTAKVFCLRHRVPKSGTDPFSPASRSRLATMPAVCRKGSSKSTSIERQNWIAASKKTGGRPRRPSCGASRAVSWSTRPLGTLPAAMPCRPVDQHRAALAQRGVIAGPVRPAVAGGRRLAPCDPSKPMDPRSEPSDVRVLKQRRATPVADARSQACSIGSAVGSRRVISRRLSSNLFVPSIRPCFSRRRRLICRRHATRRHEASQLYQWACRGNRRS